MFRLPLVLLGVSVALTALAHWPALNGGFVLDDAALLRDNPHLEGLAGLQELLTSDLFTASAEVRHTPYYRPLSSSLYWLSYQLLGTHPIAQHGLNLFLHATVTALALYLVLTVTDGTAVVPLKRASTTATHAAGPRTAVGRQRRWPGLGEVHHTALPCIGLLLFAAHPVSSELAAYIGGRQELLGWCLLLGGWTALVQFRPQGIRLALWSLLITLSAALCHEFFLCAPLLLAPSAPLLGQAGRRGLVFLALGGAAGIALVGVLRQLLGIAGPPLDSWAAGSPFNELARVAWRFIQTSFHPVDLSVNLTPTRVSTTAVGALLFLLCAGSVAVLNFCWNQPQRRALCGFALSVCWTALILRLPVLATQGFFSDRYAYAWLLGVALLIASLRPLSGTARHALLPGATLVLALLLPQTWQRDRQWHGEASLQTAALASRPNDPQAKLAEGLRRFATGDYRGAHRWCQAFAQARPASHQANYCLGAIHLAQGRPLAAVPVLREFSWRVPGHQQARIALLRSLFATHALSQVEEALNYYVRHVGETPDVIAARQELRARRFRPMHQATE